MKTADLTVRIRAVDEVTPVIQRLRWELFLLRHAEAVALYLMASTFVIGLLVGLVLRWA